MIFFKIKRPIMLTVLHSFYPNILHINLYGPKQDLSRGEFFCGDCCLIAPVSF